MTILAGLLLTLLVSDHPHPPPPEAIAACDDAEVGDPCAFDAPHGTVEGTCREGPHDMVCHPDGAPPLPPPKGGEAPRDG